MQDTEGDGAVEDSRGEASAKVSKFKKTGKKNSVSSKYGRDKADTSNSVTFEELERFSGKKKTKKSSSKSSKMTSSKASAKSARAEQKKSKSKEADTNEKSSSRLRGTNEDNNGDQSDLLEAQRKAEKEALLAVMQKRRSEMESENGLPEKISKKKHKISNRCFRWTQ